VSLDPGLANVFADPAQLHHVVLALCSHAAAAIVGPHGRIGVTAVRANVRERTRRELGLVVDGPHALIAVADNGARPDPVDVDAIFKCEASGLGVEIDPDLVKLSNASALKFGIASMSLGSCSATFAPGGSCTAFRANPPSPGSPRSLASPKAVSCISASPLAPIAAAPKRARRVASI